METEMNLPASYYGELDERNPVILAFKKEINVFFMHMKRVASAPTRDNSCYVKGIKILSEVQSKYRHRLPPMVFEENLLRIADYLFGIKCYQLALWQGYSLHLKCYSPVNVADITDVQQFMDCFFPEGFDTHQDMRLKFRALQGYVLCVFELEKRSGVLNQEGLSRLLRVLDLIRITMQAFQPHEHLCWQLYNGSLNIYNICRYLMTMSCSAQALEYLLWASCSLEMSVPLMTARYAPWRATLYSAVCRCYYNNQAAAQAQVFAKRALGKISDLAGLEEKTGTLLTSETKRAYKEATVKLATMVFKWTVFEARRRPKSFFKGRQKSNLKDIPCVPWPRTATQHMLTEMFDCSAAQFLAVLEALWDSGRRPLQTGVPEEADLHEVVLEILASGISILSGGSGSGMERGSGDDSLPTCLSALTPTGTLLELAVSGGNRVPYLSAVRFIKLLFHYEQWESFTALARQLLPVLASAEGPFFKKAELELTLLNTFESLQASQRTRLREDTMTTDKDKLRTPVSDEFICVVDTLHKSVCGTAKEMQPDSNLVVDLVLFLWSKMKGVFQREHHPGKQEVCHEWIWCLSTLCEVSFTCNLATVDHTTMAEMTLNLAMLLESAADCSTHTPCTANKEDDVEPSTFSLLKKSSEGLLQTVCEVVERADKALGRAWSRLLPRDSSAIADPAFIQKCKPRDASVPRPTASLEEDNGVENRKGQTGDEVEEQEAVAESGAKRPDRTTVSTPLLLVALDLHLQLVNIYHRASLKLLHLSPAVLTEAELLGGIGKNKASKVLFLIQSALLLHDDMDPNSSFKPKRLLEEALVLLEKAGSEERKLYSCRTSTKQPPSSTYKNKERGKREARDKPPPCPVLLFRGSHSMTFAPAPYLPEVQVCWYQICSRVAEGASVKVRLGDCSLQGTGDMVPVVSGGCELRVEGLKPNQKYVFAVAAYDSQGKLVGSSIGETTPPVLASLPLPLLSIWAHLAQAAFRTEQHTVAKKACQELWSHYTHHGKAPCSHDTQDTLALTAGLCVRTLQRSSPVLLQLFLASMLMETEINVQQGALYCDSVGGLHIWAQEARLAECERMLVAVDLAMWLDDSAAVLQAVVSCYGLLAPLIFHQITSDHTVQVLVKCLVVLEGNSAVLKQKWTRNTSESLMHMIACITYYLSKALRMLGELRVAPVLVERGCRLLQEVYEAQLLHCRLTEETERSRRARERWRGKSKKGGLVTGQFSVQMKALRRKITNGATGISHDPTSQEDPSINYNLIANSPLKSAYGDVMKLRNETCFAEFAALLLQRAREEDQPDEVIAWGEDILTSLYRPDERQSVRHLDGKGHNKSRTNETSKDKKSSPVKDRRKKQLNMPQDRTTDRELQVVDIMLSVVRSRQQRMQLRHIRSEETVWRSQLNHTIAQAHTVLLHRALKQLYGPALEQSYNHLDPLAFSLAQSRVLVRWKNALQPPEPDIISQTHRVSPVGEGVGSSSIHAHRNKEKDEAVRGEDSNRANWDKGEDVSQCKEPDPPTTTLLLDSLNRAALHLRRAMVLAHRGSHWTLLQCVCWTAWELGCSLSSVLATGALQPLGPGQLHSALTPLLVLATDLLMDMLDRLGLWSVYSGEASNEELEASLHFSSPMDDGTQVDFRWVRTLVLYTLEQLHLSGKWETLAHLAILFNSHTRERYTLMVTPLLVHAQRRLLDRITSFEGPPVPQLHHVKTQKAAGQQITIRNYAGCQLLSGWVRPTKGSLTLNNNQPEETTPAHDDNPQNMSSLCLDTLKLQEVQRSMALVRVPLDVEDTLRCYRQSVDGRPHSLLAFHHSHTLLLLLLAHTQHSLEVPVCQGATERSSGQVHFSPIVTSAPSHQPPNLAEEDYSTNLYSTPVSPNHIHTVIRAYSTSIKYLQANGHSSLTVQALHDLGNLHFYNGNTRAAHTHWCKAVDYALHCSGVLEKWDGMSWGGGACSLQDTLKLAGIWGCLQAAVLTAKIAQYMEPSDISQRTMTCLLSAHLFKCVLCCSLPRQAQCDLWYASHSVGDELFPGVDLFSDPRRAHPASAVSCLSFLCHWLYTAGHYVTLLPMLALYLYFVGTVCRDPQRTAEGRILKVRALTELSLFSPAFKEAGELIQGKGILLPHGCNFHVDESQPMRRFYSNKSLLDNNQALEDLVNHRPAPEVQKLYVSILCQRLNLARVQLVLALSSTIHSLPSAEFHDCEAHINTKGQGCSDDPLPWGQGSDVKTEDPKVLDRQKDKLTPERLKVLLLEGAFHLLTSSSQQQVPQTHSEAEELELNIEANLLMAKLYLMQGRAALSADMAVLSLVLLQTSPVIVQQSSSDEETNVLTPGEDSPRAVEARERMGTALWLQCRLALLRSLAAHIPGAAIFPGKDSHMEAMQVLEDSLEECASWRDPDTHALLLLEGASLHVYRAQAGDRMSLLQEAVGLLSGRTRMPPGSSVTLARATMLLSDLRGTDGTKLLELTQKILQQQLCVFGQCVELDAGRVFFPPAGLSNIYLPHLSLLAETTLRIGHILALRATERPISAQTPESAPGQCPSQTMGSCLQDTDRTQTPMSSPFQVPRVDPSAAAVQAWHHAHRVLRSALILSRSCAYRDIQLDTHLLRCCGSLERSLRYLSHVKRQEVAETFLECIQSSARHCPHLPMLRECYMEIALLFLHDWQHAPHKTPAPLSQKKLSSWKRLVAIMNRGLTETEGCLMLFWICLRGAAMAWKAKCGYGKLCGSIATSGEVLSKTSLEALPDFAINDLLNSCGGVHLLAQVSTNSSHPEVEHSFRIVNRGHSQLTWAHVARYYTHLLNLQQMATTPGLLGSLEVSLAPRLSQLQNFFRSHMPGYTETCCPPHPAPSDIMLLPQVLQLSPSVRASLGQAEEVYQWSVSTKQQLCMQWHQPSLPPVAGHKDTVFLLYGHNRHPMSAMRGSASVVMGLECGQRLIQIERVRAIHAELCALCASASMVLSAAASFSCSPDPEGLQPCKTQAETPLSTSTETTLSPHMEASTSPEKSIGPHMQMLKENILICCLSIKSLLNPGSKFDPLPEVPFDITLENLYDLERCFNPVGGAIVEGTALTEWILSVLTCS